VPQSKPLGDIAHRRRNCLRATGNLQQELMLLRLKIKPCRRCLAEVEKQPKLVAKLRQHLKSGFGGSWLF
jgi:hypothetical protein